MSIFDYLIVLIYVFVLAVLVWGFSIGKTTQTVRDAMNVIKLFKRKEK
jgi:hypothetical protein